MPNCPAAFNVFRALLLHCNGLDSNEYSKVLLLLGILPKKLVIFKFFLGIEILTYHHPQTHIPLIYCPYPNT
jgi:hypothetical protein